MFYKEDLIRHMKALGVQPTDVLMVHTALRSVGRICPEDSTTAEVFIDALRECVCDGLLLIPTHTWANIREDGQVFSVNDTMPCIGAVPAAAVQLAAKGEGIRSLHPTHSVVAFGKNAESYIAGDKAACTPAPWDGAFGKLYREKGKILLVGVGHARNTFFHAVDEWLDIPDRLMDTPIHVRVVDRLGNTQERTVYRHKRSMSHFFENYEPWLDATGAVTYGRMGDALARLCDARECAERVKQLWEKADHDLCAGDEKIPFPL